MNMWKVLYLVGFTPWEQTGELGAAQIDRLLAREDDSGGPSKKALDIGCGRGGHSIELARRGWQVTGIDFVPRAIKQARKRAEAAGVSIRFEVGDATEMSAVAGTGYELLMDLGCFHSLTPAQQAAYARQSAVVAEPDAALLIFAFTGTTGRGMPDGIDPDEVERLFADWKLTDTEPAVLPDRLSKLSAQWMRFQRHPLAS
jgi:cyclopropane fatty-acyl-phospholipid synthase-like methyltransferase